MLMLLRRGQYNRTGPVDMLLAVTRPGAEYHFGSGPSKYRLKPQPCPEEDCMSFSRFVQSGVAGRIVGATLVAACLVLLSGCPIKSLSGLDEGSNDRDMVFEARLVGTWPDVGEKCTSTVT